MYESETVRPPKPALAFLVDSREQNPFQFGPPVKDKFRDGGTFVRGLGEGDYSVCIDSGAPLMVRLERKSHIDLLACVGRERERFERELERLVQYERKAIIIEASADDILRGHERSQVSPRAAMASLCAWYARYDVAFIFGENHRRAGGIAQRLLEEYAAQYLHREKEHGETIEHPVDGRDVEPVVRMHAR